MPSSDRTRWRRYFRFLGPDVRADTDDEIGFHLDLRTRDLVARGMSPAAARAEAEREFGSVRDVRHEVISIEEQRIRQSHRAEMVADLRNDLRFALRMLRTSPLFSLMSIACIALGIAVTGTILSAVNGILLRPLPYHDADALVAIYARLKERNATGINVSYPDYVSWRDESHSFTGVGIWTWTTNTFSGDGEAERVEGAAVSPNLFALLGVPAILGRTFEPGEEVEGRNRVIVLSHGFWQRRFAGDRAIAGRTVTVDGLPYAVIGVMPPRFNFPERGEVWTPFTPQTNEDRGSRGYAGAIGRMRPGVTLAQAQADLDVISVRLQRAIPSDNFGWDAEAMAMRTDLVGDLRKPVLIFLVAVAFVLLIACANVANLTLARGAARERELAVRIALGAGRGRLVRQMITESLTLAAIGGALGIVAAVFGVRLLRLAFPNGVPSFIALDIDATVIAMVVAITALTGLGFGLLPALNASRVDPHDSLQSGGGSRGASAGRARVRVRSLLVVTEVALSLVLLVGAMLMIRSYRAYTTTTLGFDERGILSARVSLPPTRYAEAERRRQYFSRLYERLAALPGVEIAGSAQGIPFSGWDVQGDMSIEGRPARPQGQDLEVHYQSISPDYFRAIGVPIRAGRGFTVADRDSASHIGIINETLARMEFAGQDPIGKRIKTGRIESTAPWVTIIGVTRDYRHYRLPQPMGPALYVPQLASPSYTQTLVLRTALADPLALLPAVRAVLASLDAGVPAYQVRTFEQVVSRSLWRQRLQGQVLGLFAVLALVLASVGLYGVIAYGVTQRTREIGVRMALGATRPAIVRHIVAQGIRLAVLGLAIGLVVAFGASRALTGLLYGVGATDPLTFAGVPVALALVALLASYLPARRAARIDPVVAIRSD